jgi:nucleotide-binding universal stress UspA family protein
MHIVLALDGSEPANRARDLVAGIAWPPGTTIRVVAALEPGAELAALPWPGVDSASLETLEKAARSDIEPMLRAAAAQISAPGRSVDWELVRGRPADVLLDEARRTHADLVVLGSRGHGRLESLMLGSVPAEVVDHAPCPVLVVRGPTLSRVVFAQDGSDNATAAAGIVAAWPIFHGVPVEVLSVMSLAGPLASGVAPTMVETAIETYAESLATLESESRRMVDETAERFRAAGIPATAKVREGETAAEILDEAKETAADLIILGSRGVGGLSRLLLGSVARRVLVHAPCSVLIVHR